MPDIKNNISFILRFIFFFKKKINKNIKNINKKFPSINISNFSIK